jgi:glutamyl-tRNA synthetase
MPSADAPVTGRYAPSPTGAIHLGNARTALAAWLGARSQGGRFVWRVEDLDGPRVVPGAADEQIRDLEWLGLDWDEGPQPPGAGETAPGSEVGPHGPYYQSRRGAHYEAALRRLARDGRLFPCRRSRKDLRELASAPHGASGLPPYPRRWRPSDLMPGWYDAPPRDAALRLRVDDGLVCFDDLVQGRVCEDTAAHVGDFVLKRRDGVYAYQLAVVVDDLAMGVTQVVRGTDLLDSTARQIALIRALGADPPQYAHVGLLLEGGEKVSKREGGHALSLLRERGVAPERIVGWLGWTLGLTETDAPCSPYDLVARWQWLPQQAEPVVLADTPFDL